MAKIPVRRQDPLLVERVQTGVRLEKRLLKVLKALADYHDLSLGDLLEGIVLHAIDGKAPFGAGSRARIKNLKGVFGLTLNASHAHKLREAPRRARKRRSSGPQAAAQKPEAPMRGQGRP